MIFVLDLSNLLLVKKYFEEIILRKYLQSQKQQFRRLSWPSISSDPVDDRSFRALLQSELSVCEESRVQEPYQEGYENLLKDSILFYFLLNIAEAFKSDHWY